MEPLGHPARQRSGTRDGASSPAVAVVIPVLNESASIAAVISEIPSNVVREIIVVDGGSSDDTGEIATAAGARAIVPSQDGYGRAFLAGGTAASVDCGIIAFMDGDGADRGDLIARIVEPIHPPASSMGGRNCGFHRWTIHRRRPSYSASGTGTSNPFSSTATME
jgi:glycosyltransferase involved in cell wall biosynthesis